MSTGTREPRAQCRIERYRLIGMGTDLESQWPHTHADADDPRAALEALTAYFIG